MNKKERHPRNLIWRARQAKGLSQKDLSLIMGLKSQTILSRYENRTKLPSLENALRLSIALRYPIEILFKGLYARIEEEIPQKKPTPSSS